MGVFLVSINVWETQNYTPNAILVDTRRRYRHTNTAISAQLLDAETGQVAWLSQYGNYVNVPDNSDGKEALPLIASVVASGIPPFRNGPCLPRGSW